MLEVFVRPEGRDGYVVGYRRGGPPVECAKYPIDEIQSRHPHILAVESASRAAQAHAQGILEGIRIASNILEGEVQS